MSLRALHRLKTIFNFSVILGVLIFIGSILGYQEAIEVFYFKNNNPLAFTFFMALSVISLILSCLLIIYGLKTNQFIYKYDLAERYVEGLAEEPSSNLLKDSCGMMMYLIVGIVPGLVGAWYVYYAGNFGVWLLLTLCIFYTIYFFKGKKGLIIFHIIYLPVVFLLISVKAHEVAGFLVLFLIFLLMFARHMSLRRGQQSKTEISYRGVTIQNFIKLIRCLSAEVHKKIYGKGAVNSWQATAIVLILLAYVILPNILPFIPPNQRQELQKYLIKIDQSRDYIPHIAFFFYCGLSITPFLPFFAQILSFRQDDTIAWKRGINFIIVIVIGLLLMPMFVVLSVVMSFLILKVIDSILGFYFAIILGFFVFPAWVTRLYAYIPALMLLIIPDYILKARVEGYDMWSFSEKKLNPYSHDKATKF